MLVLAHGIVSSPGLSPYIPGLPRIARDRSTSRGRNGIVAAGKPGTRGLGPYIRGWRRIARDRSLPGGRNGIVAAEKRGPGGSTFTLPRHSVSRVAIGSPQAPPRTAAVTAPIEIPDTAAGVNPGRW